MLKQRPLGPQRNPRGGNPAPSSRALGRGLLMPTVKCEVFHALGPRGGFLFAQYLFPWAVRAGKAQAHGAGTYRLQAGGHASCSLVRSSVNKTPGSQWKSKVHQNWPGAQKFSFSKSLSSSGLAGPVDRHENQQDTFSNSDCQPTLSGAGLASTTHTSPCPGG